MFGLTCPDDATDCVNQAPPPEGDGCADAERWVRDILNPATCRTRTRPPPKPRREYVLSDLPDQCAATLTQ